VITGWYCSITVANHQLISVIRFVSKNYICSFSFCKYTTFSIPCGSSSFLWNIDLSRQFVSPQLGTRWDDVMWQWDRVHQLNMQKGAGQCGRNRPYGAQFTGDRKLGPPASAPGVESDWFSEKRNSFLLTGPTWCHVCEETDRKTLLIQKILLICFRASLRTPFFQEKIIFRKGNELFFL